MRVRVLFFGKVRDMAGAAAETLELPEGASLQDLLQVCSARIPGLNASLSSLALAVNQQYAHPDTTLKPDDEVALLPPVSGGAPGATAKNPSAGGSEETHNPEILGSVGHALIVSNAIDTQQIISKLKRGEDGALVVFEGVVRNQTRGRGTIYLDYEAYEQMARQQMEALASQALRQFQIRDVVLVHRLGRLEIGETSVLVAVVSAHRADAFEACRWLIDTLKRTVPIWKKEHFADGAVWADGEPFPAEIPRANSCSAGSPPEGSASK